MTWLCRNVFVMHGTPRPVDASVARPGTPTFNLLSFNCGHPAQAHGWHAWRPAAGPLAHSDDKIATCHAQAPRWARSGCMTRLWSTSLGQKPVTSLWSGTAKQHQQQAAVMATANRWVYQLLGGRHWLIPTAPFCNIPCDHSFCACGHQA